METRKELERFLYEMCVNTQVALPLKRDPHYMVSELIGPFVRRFHELVLPDVYQSSLGTLRALKANVIMDNVMEHDDPCAEHVSPQDARAFAQIVRDFEGLFTCSKGHLVQYHCDAKVLVCECGNKKWETK